MMTTRRTVVQVISGASLILTPALGRAAFAQTPKAGGCDTAATPDAMMRMDHSAMGHGTPMAGMHEVEFDQMYIDMMLSHHQSIIALSETALPMLTDSRLKAMAQDIIDSQTVEQGMMRELREEWYGSPEPDPLSDEMMMITMGHSMCDDMDMDQMMNIMDADWQVKTFLAANDPDLAFIEQTILHHQMAIDSSKIALEQAVHPELKEIAQDVIDAQQREIDTLEAIRTELTGEATPTA